MFVSFREIFNPTIEEQIAKYERYLELHNEQIGHCSTCIYYEPSTAPGFVTDYGSCRINKNIFTMKVCSFENLECDGYEHDFETVDALKTLIDDLKKEKE